MLNRSPPSLIHEIILMDDASDAPWLGERLRTFVAQHLPPKVKLVRSDERSGLIRARLKGAAVATGVCRSMNALFCNSTASFPR